MQVELQHIYTGHADAVYSLCEGHEPHLFYSGSADNFVGCWNAETGTFQNPLVKSTGSIYSLLHDMENRVLYVGQRYGIVLIVDLNKQESPRSVQAHDGDVFSIVKDKTGNILTAGGDGHMKVWTSKEFKLLHDFRLSTANVRCIHFSPQKDEIFAGLSDHTIRVFDAGTYIQKQVLTGHQNSVFTIESLDENRLITAGRDAVFLIWEKENAQWIHTQTIPAHLYTVNHLSISPDGKLLASASRDKTFKIWDAATLTLLKVMDQSKFSEAHTHSVNRLLWMGNQHLISTGDDKKIFSWQIS